MYFRRLSFLSAAFGGNGEIGIVIVIFLALCSALCRFCSSCSGRSDHVTTLPRIVSRVL